MSIDDADPSIRAALCMALHPEQLMCWTSARLSIKNLQTSTWPCQAANIKGVSPLSASMSTPLQCSSVRSSNHWQTSLCPLREAHPC